MKSPPRPPSVRPAKLRRDERRAKMTSWILNYLKTNVSASSVDQDFHERFHAEFGGVRKEYIWGAQPVRAAQNILADLSKEGSLDVARVSLGGNWQPGFPKWVRSYSLSSAARERLKEMEAAA